MRSILALGAALAIAAAPVSAQVVGGGLIVVNISNVANNIARDLDVNVQDVIDIGSVNVPIGIAAAVCGVNANVLAQQRNEGDNTCDATTTNRTLNQIVQRQLSQNQQ